MGTGYFASYFRCGVIHSGFVYKWKNLHQAAFWAFTKKEASPGLSSEPASVESNSRRAITGLVSNK
jgi:hypothetical protein